MVLGEPSFFFAMGFCLRAGAAGSGSGGHFSEAGTGTRAAVAVTSDVGTIPCKFQLTSTRSGRTATVLPRVDVTGREDATGNMFGHQRIPMVTASPARTTTRPPPTILRFMGPNLAGPTAWAEGSCREEAPDWTVAAKVVLSRCPGCISGLI